ncbi:efflux RND transporter periplasmic adaptor subunit [Ammoniphilus resinae]|uniref:HlyD family secretion protein n=1 Tax=Ammoniphilus resinae TaxID=861532 RepID=A0ABS4GW94_9BACL|nr:efflux RND transporter periplasmic adaptor subunit [Ammoniphilus resinae]MBP1934377.1 HlyD family secretion protein [Ammoniphilus resinae]
MKKQIKWVAAIVFAFIIGGFIIYSSVKALDVEWLEVQPQTVAQTWKEEGIVTVAAERPIYSLISGQINGLFAKEGQKVNRGDLLLAIDSKDLEFQLDQLKAQKKGLLGQERMTEQDMQKQLGQLQGQLESIEGQEKQAAKSPYQAEIKRQQLVIEETGRQLANSEEDYREMKVLYESGAVSKKQMEQAAHTVDQLENSLLQQEQELKLMNEQAIPLPGTVQYYSGLKQAIQTQIDILQQELNQEKAETGTNQYYQGQLEAVEAQMKHLTYQMANRKVFSPIQGVVKEVSTKEGAAIPVNAPLLTVIPDGGLQVEAYLLTEDVMDVKSGMKVQLIQKRRNGEYTFSGTVQAIAPAAVEKISSLGLIQQKIKVTIIPEDQEVALRPGYAIDVLFTTLEQPNQLAVPPEVLFPYEKGDALWVVRDGKAVIQPVQKGMETDDLVVIEKGLSAGDQVILNPQQEGLKQGKRVK